MMKTTVNLAPDGFNGFVISKDMSFSLKLMKIISGIISIYMDLGRESHISSKSFQFISPITFIYLCSEAM